MTVLTITKEFAMAQVLKETRYVERGSTQVDEDGEKSMTVFARAVYLVSGIINALLAVRFLLALLGANPTNAFADFIYSVTKPLVAPFFGLFNYQTVYGEVRFEFETLIAIAVYSLIAWGIVRMATINSDKPVE